MSTIIIKPSQLAIICLSFAEYVAEAFTYECAPSSEILKIIGVTTVGENLIQFIKQLFEWMPNSLIVN